jgi:hypothetical protein
VIACDVFFEMYFVFFVSSSPDALYTPTDDSDDEEVEVVDFSSFDLLLSDFLLNTTGVQSWWS